MGHIPMLQYGRAADCLSTLTGSGNRLNQWGKRQQDSWPVRATGGHWRQSFMDEFIFNNSVLKCQSDSRYNAGARISSIPLTSLHAGG